MVALGSFVLIEKRRRAPMLDLALFRNRTYVGANVSVLLVALSMFGVFFFISLYMQNILGYSRSRPARLPADDDPRHPRCTMGGRLADHFGSRWLMATGMALLTVHLLLLTRLELSSSYVTTILPSLMIGGVGIALVMTPGERCSDEGRLGGQGRCRLGGAERVSPGRWLVGVALMGAIVATQVGATRTPEAFLNGLHSALLVAALIALGGAVLSAISSVTGEPTTPPRRSRPPRPRPCEQARVSPPAARHVMPAGFRRPSAGRRFSMRRCGSSARGATRARRRRRSLRKPASRSRSSIATSLRNGRSGWRASTRRGLASASRTRRSSWPSGEERGMDAFGQVLDEMRRSACCSRASGCRVSPRPPRTPRSSDMSAGTCAPPTTSSPPGCVKARNAAASRGPRPGRGGVDHDRRRAADGGRRPARRRAHA